MTRAWALLLLAGCFEIAWAVALTRTAGWTRLWPSLLTIALMAVSFVLLARAMREVPMGTAYAVWTGVGAVGVAAVGMIFLREPASPVRVACIALIVLGIVGLKLTSHAPAWPGTEGRSLVPDRPTPPPLS